MAIFFQFSREFIDAQLNKFRDLYISIKSEPKQKENLQIIAVFFQFSREFSNAQLNKFRDLYISIKFEPKWKENLQIIAIFFHISIKAELKYKILAIIKNTIKNKKTTGVPTSYQSRYFTNLD